MIIASGITPSSMKKQNSNTAADPSGFTPEETVFHSLRLDLKLEMWNEKLAKLDSGFKDMHLMEMPKELKDAVEEQLKAKNETIVRLQQDIMRLTQARDLDKYTYLPDNVKENAAPIIHQQPSSADNNLNEDAIEDII